MGCRLKCLYLFRLICEIRMSLCLKYKKVIYFRTLMLKRETADFTTQLKIKLCHTLAVAESIYCLQDAFYSGVVSTQCF